MEMQKCQFTENIKKVYIYMVTYLDVTKKKKKIISVYINIFTLRNFTEQDRSSCTSDLIKQKAGVARGVNVKRTQNLILYISCSNTVHSCS